MIGLLVVFLLNMPYRRPFKVTKAGKLVYFCLTATDFPDIRQLNTIKISPLWTEFL